MPQARTPDEPPHTTYILTLSCPNRTGIVHAVSGFLLARDCDILDSQQYGEDGVFFLRVHFAADAVDVAEPGLARLRTEFQPLAAIYSMEWRIDDATRRTRTLIMVSQYGHCLNDLLFRAHAGALPIDITAVVSNHEDFRAMTDSYGIPFHHLPVTRETKAEAEQRLLALIDETDAELVILARYMQILSEDVCKRLDSRVINIHHSFLPSFKGAKPYHQAHARGVKLIGATAHYVTADLDEGPIIEQDVIRVDHRAAPEDLAAIGRDVEGQVLARAVKRHAEHRILRHGRRTVVFS
ncbi:MULTISPECIES: formyltetrahydrofolate deformylase [unclassified Streptomyces]|uniref:formyltetrahydrofolate deformylase n=1 Tax=unclassified Streptomyces TaxID=2593676 RepID=UPI00278C671B|nr:MULTISPECIES: formyltetrahydrofolate deformylase [unclassified Streptomyces]